MNPIRLNSLYSGAFALQWIALLAAFSLEGTVWLVAGGLVGAIIFAVSLHIGKQGRHHQYNESFSQIVMAVSFFLSLLICFVLGIEKGVFYLLLGMIVAGNLSMTTRRNLYFTYLGTLFIVLYAASRSYGNIFTIWIILYVLAGVFTLMLAHTDSRLEASLSDDNYDRPAISLAAVILVTLCLLLGTGSIYLLFPRLPPVQVSAFPSSGGTDYDADSLEDNRSGGGGSGETGGTQGKAGSQAEPMQGGGTGIKDSHAPRDISLQGGFDYSLMFYLQADRPLYVRTHVYNDFDGTIWRYTDPGEISLYRPHRRFVFDGVVPEDKGSIVYQHYIIQEYNDASLPLALRPTVVRFPGNTLRVNGEGSITALRPLQEGTSYAVESYQQIVASHLADGSGDQEINRRRYLQVPPQVTDRTTQMAEEITIDVDSDLDRAIRIESYLQENYPYSLSSYGIHPEAGLVEWFLFDNRKGHCELFASAMIMMLRKLDIPARFVAGYTSDDPNPITGYQEVRNPGHAWVEAWLPPLGWVTFDPTADWGEIQSSTSPMLIIPLIHYIKEQISQMQQGEDGESWLVKLLQVIHSFLQIIWVMVKKIIFVLSTGWELFTVWLKMSGAWWVTLILISLTAWYVMRLWIGGQLALIRLALSSEQANESRVMLGWYEMESAFARSGISRPDSATPYEFQLRIGSFLPQKINGVDILCSAFQQARYGNRPLNNSDMEKALRISSQLIRSTMHPLLPLWLKRFFRK